jgi:uncharacterized membrane protein
MNSPDPVSAPTDDGTAGLVGQPNQLDAGRGTAWLSEGWRLFKLSPWLWIGMVIVYIVIMMAVSAIPVVSILASLFGPVFTAGFMVACRALDRGEPMEFGQLFAGFSRHTGGLLGVGVITILGTLVAFLVAGLIVLGGNADLIMSMISGTPPDPDRIAAMGLSFVLAVLVAVALALPVYMAMWFAPVLVMLHGKGTVDAMKLSLAGCLRNIVPFLVYGVVALLLAILASIPFMLGWLALIPVLIAATYGAYKDIYLEAR